MVSSRLEGLGDHRCKNFFRSCLLKEGRITRGVNSMRGYSYAPRSKTSRGKTPTKYVVILEILIRDCLGREFSYSMELSKGEIPQTPVARAMYRLRYLPVDEEEE
jgi:hypothetical protein